MRSPRVIWFKRVLVAAVMCALLALAGCGPTAAERARAGFDTTSAVAAEVAPAFAASESTPSTEPTGSVEPTPSTEPTPSAPPTMPPLPAGKVPFPKTGAYIGVFQPQAPFKMGALDTFNKRSKKDPAILMWYQPWAPKGTSKFDRGAVIATYKKGAIPMITWEPWDPGIDPKVLKHPNKQPKYRLANIASGKFDSYIKSWAQGVKSVKGPVMIRLMHEMNGTWYPWCGTVNGNSPALYKKAWRRVWHIFKQEGATNVTWIWSINGKSVPDKKSNRYAAYYPGDSYVDWVGTSGFNWGTSRKTFKWQKFDALYAKPLAYLEKTKKPVMISEMGTVGVGGSKPAWIADAYKKLRNSHKRVHAVVYYNTKDVRPSDRQDWRIDSSKSSRRAYERAVGLSYYRGGPPAFLSAWIKKLDSDAWADLQKLPRVY